MGLTPRCPRCRRRLEDGCPVHGAQPTLWRPDHVAYDAFASHLRAAADFPTYLPWPLAPGWAVSDFGVVVDRSERPLATVTCCSGVTDLDGRVDVFVVVEEPGVGLGGRCAGLESADPGTEFGLGSPAARVRINSLGVRLWPVSTSAARGDLDRSVVAGEAGGRWLWLVLLPASAMLLMRDDWILRDVSALGAPLVELPFAGPGPDW
jgi:hypothetical protein